MDQKYLSFVNMNEERRDKIVCAALKEFSNYPYSASSINRILEDAKFSKGGIYHYFSSKKDLYIGVGQFIIEYYLKELKRELPVSSGDILKQMEICSGIQDRIREKYPYYSEYIVKASECSELKEYMDSLNKQEYDLIFGTVDENLLKDNITQEEAVFLVISAVGGVMYQEWDRDGEKLGLEMKHRVYTDKMFELIKVLKKVLYK